MPSENGFTADDYLGAAWTRREQGGAVNEEWARTTLLFAIARSLQDITDALEEIAEKLPARDDE